MQAQDDRSVNALLRIRTYFPCPTGKRSSADLRWFGDCEPAFQHLKRRRSQYPDDRLLGRTKALAGKQPSKSGTCARAFVSAGAQTPPNFQRSFVTEVTMARQHDTEHEKGTQKPKGTMTVQEAGKMGGEIRKEELGPEGYSEIGKMGGEVRKEQLGHEGYSEMGKKGGEARKEQLGPEGYSEMGKMGGEARKEQLGPEGYSELGHKGGQRVKQLIEEGKRAEADEGGEEGMSENEESKGRGMTGHSKPRH
ncbi:hypothetical protein MMG94_07820 [Methylocystis parvus OBBP]|nr:KGG domain-containing protein [Methylocystis parvus]WBK01597.1 hypothetical protein MMG94_07820 [Methylocystis parvus OBBP]